MTTAAVRRPFVVRVRRMPRRPQLWTGLGLLAAMLILGPVTAAVSGYDPADFVGVPREAPSTAHWFGTDLFGRDVLVRTFAAARADFLVAGIAVTVAASVGTAVGTLAGTTRRGWIDWSLMRLVDAIISFPFVVLVLALVVALGADRSYLGLPAGLAPALVAFCVTGWAYYARIARAQALSLRERDFVVAARLLGLSEWRIVTRHVLPAVAGTTIAYAIGDAIITIAFTASLSLLGAGVQPPTPEWGQMMYEARSYLDTAWWITLFPALALVVSGFGLSMVGDALIKRIEGSDR